jgi:hypothetical protein
MIAEVRAVISLTLALLAACNTVWGLESTALLVDEDRDDVEDRDDN